MKNIISLCSFLILFLFLPNIIVFGQDIGDCQIVKGKISDIWENSNFDNLYPSEARIQALDNLKGYCCNNNLLDKSDCEGFVVNYSYPESPYLFDHLFDIGMRRLDASAMYGLSADSLGEDWRNYIRKVAIDADGEFASSIENEYKKYWTLDNDAYKFSFDTIDKLKNLDENGLIKINSDYVLASLYQKYIEQCGIAYEMYIKIKKNYQYNGIVVDEVLPVCKAYTLKRINTELEYTKMLVLQKSTKLMIDNIHDYLYNYFSKNRLMQLQETIFSISDLFQTIAKSFPGGTSECS